MDVESKRDVLSGGGMCVRRVGHWGLVGADYLSRKRARARERERERERKERERENRARAREMNGQPGAHAGADGAQ